MSKPSQIASSDADAATVRQPPPDPGTATASRQPTEPAPGAGRAQVQPRALLRAMRPRQWIKNVLVAAAPGAAGVLTQPAVAGRVLLAFVAFCLVSSAIYLFNDIADVEADTHHPVKPSARSRAARSRWGWRPARPGQLWRWDWCWRWCCGRRSRCCWSATCC